MNESIVAIRLAGSPGHSNLKLLVSQAFCWAPTTGAPDGVSSVTESTEHVTVIAGKACGLFTSRGMVNDVICALTVAVTDRVTRRPPGPATVSV